MKKLFLLTIMLLALLALSSCGSKYPAVESTEEEARVVMTLELDGKHYDVRYELYRALFLANKYTVDGGDESVWSGANSSDYVAMINEIIYDRVADIYACLYLAESIGDNVYSREYEDQIDEYIRINVEGSGNIKGHGTYEKYLESLKEKNMNYSVSVLMIRYAIALNRINEYYFGAEDDVLESNGNLEFTKADVESFYYGSDSVRVLTAFIHEGVRTEDELNSLRNAMDKKSTDLEVALCIINNTTATATELIEDKSVRGSIIGKHSLDSVFYSEYIEAAFSTEVGDVSEIATVSGLNDGFSDGCYIFYVLAKDAAHLEKYYDDVEAAYIENRVGEIRDQIKSSLKSSIMLTGDGLSIIHKDIKMDSE